MGFNKTVLTVATVVFVVMLTVTALLIKNSYRNKMFPAEIPKCPDFWEVMDDGSCKYIGKNGNPDLTKGTILSTFANKKDNRLTRKQMCDWAKDNVELWEGIWDGEKCVTKKKT